MTRTMGRSYRRMGSGLLGNSSEWTLTFIYDYTDYLRYAGLYFYLSVPKLSVYYKTKRGLDLRSSISELWRCEQLILKKLPLSR
jgi:hypothetical protein